MHRSQGLGGPKKNIRWPNHSVCSLWAKTGTLPACAGATLLLHDTDTAITANGGGHADLGVTVV